jgi:hypothetical protein
VTDGLLVKVLRTYRFPSKRPTQSNRGLIETFNAPVSLLHALSASYAVLHFIEYYYFIDPSLPPGSFSLVVRGGDDGYSCYVQGNNAIWYPPVQTTGYADGMCCSSDCKDSIEMTNLYKRP